MKNKSDFGLEFPQSHQARADFFNTLERLSLYKSEPSWEDIIMEEMYKKMANIQIPDKIFVNPRTFNILKDQLK